MGFAIAGLADRKKKVGAAVTKSDPNSNIRTGYLQAIGNSI
jgi:hypothetical protein